MPAWIDQDSRKVSTSWASWTTGALGAPSAILYWANFSQSFYQCGSRWRGSCCEILWVVECRVCV